MIGRISLLRWVAGDNEEFVLSSFSVVAVRILPPSEAALGQVYRSWTLVAVFPAILAGNVGQITCGSHILERVMQKGIFRLAVLGIIIDTTHCLGTLKRGWLYMLNFKPVSPGEILRPSTK